MKKLTAAIAVLMTLAMLAGCTTVAPTSDPTTAPTVAPAATVAPTATPEATAEATVAPTAALPNSVEGIKARGELIVATNAEFPPFEYMEGDKIVGIDMEIAQAIADQLGVKLKIDNMNFDSVLASIQTGKGDLAIAGLSATEDRKKSVDFSDSYFSSTVVMLVAKGNDKLKTKEDLVGKKLGVQLGTSADTLVASGIDKAEVVRMNKDADSIQDLINGKLDAVLLDISPAKVFAEQNADKIKLIETPMSDEPYAVAANKGNTELVTFVNGVIKELKDSGKYDELLTKYKLK
jgi:arginine/lysine/histidine transporter system substrate-binding protein